MYLRTGADIADLSFYEDVRIDGFEGFDRLFGLAYVFLERQRGNIKDDGIKSGPGCFYSVQGASGYDRR